MSFSPVSFLLGVGVACLAPVISRGFRPLAIEAAAFGITALQDLRRVMAEQLETFEDIAAEARSRLDAAREALSEAAELDDTAQAEDEAPPRPRRRQPARDRSRSS